jgi:membrane protease YdiL (CAAX protease family)
MLVVGVVTVFCLGNLGMASFGRSGGSQAGRTSFTTLVVATLSLHGAILGVLPNFLRVHHASWAGAFGLRRRPGFWGLVGLAAGVLSIPGTYWVQGLSASALKRLGWDPKMQDAVEMLIKGGPPAQQAYLLFFAVCVAPVAEEALFRGVLLPFFRERIGTWAAVAATAAGFGALHANAAAFVPLTMLGAVFAGLYLRSGNLACSIAAHAAFNLYPFLAVWLGWASDT